MGRLFLLTLLTTSFLILTGCSVNSQADTVIYGTETELIQSTTATPPTTSTPLQSTTKITEIQTAFDSKPASFSISDLTIEPREVATGAFFSISVTATNTGGGQGNYNATLYINEIQVDGPSNVNIISTQTFNKSEIIAAGESTIITFDSLTLEAGTYTATIGDLVDYLEVGC